MKTIHTLIVEDEIKSQELLSAILKDYCPKCQNLGVASTIDQAKEFISQNLNVDILFLDVNLGGESSLELLESIDNPSFKIIFTTAYERYALQAFEHGAVDYLLKPYSPKQVISAVSKAENMLVEKRILEGLYARPSYAHDNRLSIRTSEGIFLYNLDEILRIEGQGAYSKLIFHQGSTVVSKSLKKIETLLPAYFYRSHDSHIVNMHKVSSFNNQDGGYIILNNKDTVPVSRRKKPQFLEQLKHLAIEL